MGSIKDHSFVSKHRFALGIIVLHFVSSGCSQDTGSDNSSQTSVPTSSSLPVSLLPDGSVRLVDGNQPYEGRIEVYYQGVWGTICDESWNMNTIIVTCRQLGYRTAASAQQGAHYGVGSGPILLDGLNCGGYENGLADCQNNGWSIPSTCDHSQDAGAVCTVDDGSPTLSPVPTMDGSLRLTDGTMISNGRVEIYYLGEWGTICHTPNQFDIMMADVICKQLGYISADDTDLLLQMEFRPGTGPIHLSDVECDGTESKLVLCSHGRWGKNDCSHSNDFTVSCKTYLPPQDGSIRLVDGRGSQSGQVEISYQGVWGTVCDTDWNIVEASVVCRQLGYQPARTSLSFSYFGDYELIPVFLDSIECTGLESRLDECQHKWRSGACDHTENVGVICGAPLNLKPVSDKDDGRVRLEGGTYPHHGRVEIKYQGRWGTVCDQGWNIQAATVVCRQLGYPSADSALPKSFYGQSTKTTLLDDVSCDGKESELILCSHGKWDDNNCDQSQDASVVCTAPAPDGAIPDGRIRLVDGDSPLRGRLEIHYQGVWGTVCGDNWRSVNSDIVCQQLGYRSADPSLPHYRVLTEGLASSIVLDEVVCSGKERQLVDCLHSGWGITDCNHQRDIGVVCYNATTWSPDTTIETGDTNGEKDEKDNTLATVDIEENIKPSSSPVQKGMSTGLWIVIIMAVILIIISIAFIIVLISKKYCIQSSKPAYHTALPMEDKV